MAFGINLHHFHKRQDSQDVILQGSVEQDNFIAILERLQSRYNLLNPDVWLEKAMQGCLGDCDICLTFDDVIKSQYTIAKPVLDAMDIKAFFFAYTGMYTGSLPRLEIYRVFRSKFFLDFETFYSAFLQQLPSHIDIETICSTFPEKYLSQFAFYSHNERVFRYIRDVVMTEEEYCEVIDTMISQYTTLEALAESIWIKPSELRQLSKEGHELGLHSVTHPTAMAQKSDDKQRCEYVDNKHYLENLTGSTVRSVAYPSGSYNQFTLDLMKELCIVAGFRSDNCSTGDSPLEVPRLDGSNLQSEIAKT